MAGKRKHADMSGQALLEQRITTRCRNLSLEDEEDVDKDARPHAPNAGVECLDAPAPAFLGEASSAGAASAAAGDAGVQQLASSVACRLNSALSDEIERLESRSGHEDAGTRQGHEEPATPHLSDSHHALASESSARSTAGHPEAGAASHGGRRGRPRSGRAAPPKDAPPRQEPRPRAAQLQQHQLAADADEPAVTVGRSRRSENEDGADEGKSGTESVQTGTSAASNHVPSVERRQENERAAARVLQDKEGGIHMSCDPLASVPLEELAMSSGSMRPVSAALRTALTINASAPHSETPDARGKERRADVPAGSDVPVHLPWSGGGSSSVRPANVPNVPNSAPACFSTSAGTALEVVSCVCRCRLSLAC